MGCTQSRADAAPRAPADSYRSGAKVAAAGGGKGNPSSRSLRGLTSKTDSVMGLSATTSATARTVPHEVFFSDTSSHHSADGHTVNVEDPVMDTSSHESGHVEGNPLGQFIHIDLPFDKSIEEVYDGVRDGPELGTGVCGVVRRITHKITGEQFAVKRLELSLVTTEEELLRLKEEIFIMCQLDHPNIVRLEEVYESPAEIFLVGELLCGGELFDRLDEQPDYRYTEAESARLVTQMLNSVRYIHSKGIVHRDLKLENYLFDGEGPDAALKMIDFGLSKHFNVGDVQDEIVGTPYTVAPEVLSGRYNQRCDVWAVGVLTYFLLSGDPPFGGCGGPEPLSEIRDNILAGRYEFEPREIWDGVSDDAKDFVRALLVTDPGRRLTAREALNLPWLVRCGNGEMSLSGRRLNPSVMKAPNGPNSRMESLL